MELTGIFFINSILLGCGLAMDAFSVSVADGLNEPDMKTSKRCAIAGIFAFFQAAMPMTGWFCVHTLIGYFNVFEKYVPIAALLLLAFIGGKMIADAVKNAEEDENEVRTLTPGILLLQGVATSIDALSVGFTIAEYNTATALICALIIAAVTFIICMAGLFAGNKIGEKASGKASVLGGVILIAIGIEIFVTSLF